MQKIEFKVGDVVTFQAWECNKPVKAKVIDFVSEGEVSFINKGKKFYRLSGVNKPLVTVTSGSSIMESIYFKAGKFKNWIK